MNQNRGRSQFLQKTANKTNILVRKAETEYNIRLLRDTANISQKFWQAIKKAFPLKESVTCLKLYLIDGILLLNHC